MHLYEISDQYRGLQRIMDEGALDAETFEDTMEGIQLLAEDKCSGMLYVMANLRVQANAYDEEIKRMQARKKSLDANHSWLKEYLRENMSAMGITEITADHFSAKLGQPGKVVEIVDESLIPAIMLKHVPASYTPVKADIAKALKAGQDVPGARLIDGQYRITIR